MALRPRRSRKPTTHRVSPEEDRLRLVRGLARLLIGRLQFRLSHFVAVVLAAGFAGVATLLFAQVVELDDPIDDDETVAEEVSVPIQPRIIDFRRGAEDTNSSFGNGRIEVFTGEGRAGGQEPTVRRIPGTRAGVVLEWPRVPAPTSATDEDDAESEQPTGELLDEPIVTTISESPEAESDSPVRVPHQSHVARQSVVYEWPSRYPAVSPTDSDDDATTPVSEDVPSELATARAAMKEARAFASAGDISSAILLARQVRSRNVEWPADEESPQQFLESLLSQAAGDSQSVTIGAAAQPADSNVIATNPVPGPQQPVRPPGFLGEWETVGTAGSSNPGVAATEPGATASDPRIRSLPELGAVHMETQTTSSGSDSTNSPRRTQGTAIVPFESTAVADVAQPAASGSNDAQRTAGNQTQPVPHLTASSENSNGVTSGRNADTFGETGRSITNTIHDSSVVQADATTAHDQHEALMESGPLQQVGRQPDALRQENDQPARTPIEPFVSTLRLDESLATAQDGSPKTTLNDAANSVLITLVSVFAVLFFASLLVLLAIMSCARRLVSASGITFKVEVVNGTPTNIPPVVNVTVPTTTVSVPVESSTDVGGQESAASEERQEVLPEATINAPVQASTEPSPEPALDAAADSSPEMIEPAAAVESEPEVDTEPEQTLPFKQVVDVGDSIEESVSLDEMEPVQSEAEEEPVDALVDDAANENESDKLDAPQLERSETTAELTASENETPNGQEEPERQASPIVAQFLTSNAQLRADLADRRRRAG